jgi:Arc/MetJ-type ribon-helix-helix transcriptional regulator
VTDLSFETQQRIEELVASGRFENRQAVIDEAVRLLCANGEPKPEQVSAEDWCARFEAWASGHRAVPVEADDRRERIYEGRGE